MIKQAKQAIERLSIWWSGHPKDPTIRGWIGRPVAAGVSINEESAFNIIAFLQGVRLISATVASLPTITYRRVGAGKERAENHPVSRLLRVAPNPEMTAYTYKEILQGHLCSWGNAYSEIEFNMLGEPIALWPLMPWLVEPRRDRTTRRIVYDYHVPESSVRVIPAASILHVKAFGNDGLIGWSPIRKAAEGLGITMAAETYGAAFYGNDARPGGYVSHPGMLSDKAYERLTESLRETNAGPGNSFQPQVLEEGMTWQQVGLPNDSIQFLETRKFQITEIARLLGVPPHKLGDLERATFSNIEQQEIAFIQDSIQDPWLNRWEAEINAKLFRPDEQDAFFVEHLLLGRLRGDSQARAQFYRQMWGIGGLTMNNILAAENMNAIGEIGDQRFVPANMITLEQAIAQTRDEGGDPPGGENQENDDDVANDDRELRRLAAGVLEDAIRRVLSKEANAALRASKTHAELLSWADRFYGEHGAFVASVVRPAARLAARLATNSPSAEQIADRHCQISKQAIISLAEQADTHELKQCVTRETKQWLDARPREEAAFLLTEDKDDAKDAQAA